MLSSQNSHLAIVPGNGRRNPPAGSDDVFEPLLDSKEAAALLKMHPRILKRNARQGKTPGIYVGRTFGRTCRQSKEGQSKYIG